MVKKVLYFMTVILLFFFVSGCDVFDPPPIYGWFSEYENIITIVKPADLNVYESLLPEHLSMPDKPMVYIMVFNWSGVKIPLLPYYESCIGLRAVEPITQQEGVLILTMPLTRWVPQAGGLMLGFPKYVCHDITLEPDEGHDLVGTVVHNGRLLTKMEFDGYGHELVDMLGYDEQQIKDVLKDKYSLYDPVDGKAEYSVDLFETLILLSDPIHMVYPPAEVTPPGTKTKLRMARLYHKPHKKYDREVGLLRVTVDPNDPWGGLFPASSFEVLAYRTNWEGSADLSNVNK